MSSELINSTVVKTSGNKLYAAVVFPAPFGPAMIYIVGITAVI